MVLSPKEPDWLIVEQNKKKARIESRDFLSGIPRLCGDVNHDNLDGVGAL